MEATSIMNEKLTRQQAADYLKLSMSTIKNRIKDGFFKEGVHYTRIGGRYLFNYSALKNL